MSRQIRNMAWKAIGAAVVVSMLGTTVAQALSGGLDSSFGGTGKVTTALAGGWSDYARAVAIQTDGKIVVVGDQWDLGTSSLKGAAYARYTDEGELDATFGSGGTSLVTFGAAGQAMGVAVWNGKIVVSGQICTSGGSICDLVVVRYLDDGVTIDPTFNGGAVRLIDFGGGDNGTFAGLVVTRDGKIIVAGYMWNGSNYDMAVYRLKANGGLDGTFSKDGKVSIGFGAGKQDYAYDVRVSGGKVIVAGAACNASETDCSFAVARLSSGGTLDTTFSGDGKQVTDLAPYSSARSLAVQSDGKILVAGFKAPTGSTSLMAVVRYLPNGSLDKTFSGDGKQGVDIGGYAGVREVLLQGTKIMLGGYGYNGSNDDFAVVRLKANGALDTGYDGDGKVLIDFGANDRGLAMARQPSDGAYVIVGYTGDGALRDLAAARILP